MNFRNGKKRRSIGELNLTPLIDIVFNLLIFFLITSTFVHNPGIEVNLPKASTAPVESKSENVIVAVTANGEYLHQGKALSQTELREMLQEAKQTTPGAVVIIQADNDTQHGKVVDAMDIARQVGFEKLAIATESE